MPFNRRQALGWAAGLSATSPWSAFAASFPDKPVKIMVGFAAGGAADIVARQVAAVMGGQTGKPFIVENRPGATGTIAAGALAHAPADGYTLMLASQSTMVVAPVIYPKLAFDPVKDFIALTLLVSMPMVLVVNTAVPAKSVAELMALARSGDALAFASAGAGGPQHVAGELFASMGKLKLTHIPYKGEAPALADVIGGQVPMMFGNLPAVMPHVQGGRLRALAVSSANRHPSYPDLPTVAEAGGLPDFDVQTWYGLFAPAGTPAAVGRILEENAIAALKSPALLAKLGEQGFTVQATSQQAFTAFVKTEVPRQALLLKSANIRAD